MFAVKLTCEELCHRFWWPSLEEDVLLSFFNRVLQTDWSHTHLQVHPHFNGQVEKMNQDLEVSLSCMVSKDPSSWLSQLPWVEYAQCSVL